MRRQGQSGVGGENHLHAHGPQVSLFGGGGWTGPFERNPGIKLRVFLGFPYVSRAETYRKRGRSIVPPVDRPG